MKRLKYTLIAVLLATTILLPLVGSMWLGRASAAAFDSSTSVNRVMAHLYANAMAFCIAGNKTALSLADAQSGQYFPTPVGGYGTSTVQAGYLVDSSDGQVGCQDNGSGSWISQALSLWGLDPSDPTTALCTLGWTSGAAGQSVSQCASVSSGTFTPPSTSKFFNNLNELLYQKGGSSMALDAADVYTLYANTYIVACGATDQGPYATASNTLQGEADTTDGSANYDKMYIPAADGTIAYDIFQSQKDRNDNEYAQIANDLTSYKPECHTMVTLANANAQAYANYAKSSGDTSGVPGDPANTTNGGADDGTNGNIDTSCGGVKNVLTDPLKWLACPIVKGFSATAGALDSAIMSMLCVDESQVFGTQSSCNSGEPLNTTSSTGYKNAWDVFRIVALGLLAIAALIMILSQTIGLEIVDAYTVRKTLPRLLVAAIGISLSWQLLNFFVTLSNVLGVGVRGLIYAPFVSAGVNTVVLGGGASAVAFLTSLGALAILGPLGILSLVATALLAIIVAFFVLVLRNILVVILVITAPIAIVAYILPNTEKVWKIWWEWFSKALMVFPIITAFIAAGHVFAAIASQQSQTGAENGVVSSVSNMAGFIAYFAPYFLIPLTFRLAGGALGTLGGMVNDRSRGAFDRLKKFRGDRSAQNIQRMRDGERFNNKGLNAITARATTSRLGFGQRGKAAYAQKKALAAMRHAKSDAGQAGQFHDGMLRAQTFSSEAEARAGMVEAFDMYKKDRRGNYETDSAGNRIADYAGVDSAITAAKANGGFGEARQVYAAKQLAATGTGYDNIKQVASTIARVSGGNEESIGDLAGNINSTTKQMGRYDLAPGYSELAALARDEHAAGPRATRTADQTAGLAANRQAATVAASRGVDPVTWLRGKPQEAQNLTESLAAHAEAVHAQVLAAPDKRSRAIATDEFLMTMGQIDQVEQSKSYASTDNQEHVNRLLDRTRGLREGTLQEMLGNSAGPSGLLGPDGRPVRAAITPEQQQNRDRYNQASAPRYNPNDVRNQP